MPIPWVKPSVRHALIGNTWLLNLFADLSHVDTMTATTLSGDLVQCRKTGRRAPRIQCVTHPK
jgi:hypothetical protein